MLQPLHILYMTFLYFLLTGALAILYIHTTLQAREIATRLAINACKQQGYQFLDGTVFREKTRLTFKPKLQLERQYRFEYSITGDDRHNGYLNITGKRLSALVLKERNH